MFPAAVRLLSIKDLKALRFFLSAFSIDMQVLTDLKSFFTGACFPLRRARACPLPSHRAHERSRGTGPRATGQAGVLLLRRFTAHPQAIPNYRWAFGFRVDRAIAGACPPRYGR